MDLIIVFLSMGIITILSKKIIEAFTEKTVSIIPLMVVVVVMLLLLYLEVSLSVTFYGLALFFFYLLVTGWIDGLTFDVYDIINYIAIGVGMAYHIFFGQGFVFGLMGFIVGLLSFGLIYAVALLIYKKEAFGLGDVWILGVVGCFIGFKGVLLVAIASFYIAALHLIILALKNGKLDRKQRISFGPYICIAAFVYVIFGNELIHFYLTTFL